MFGFGWRADFCLRPNRIFSSDDIVAGSVLGTSGSISAGIRRHSFQSLTRPPAGSCGGAALALAIAACRSAADAAIFAANSSCQVTLKSLAAYAAVRLLAPGFGITVNPRMSRHRCPRGHDAAHVTFAGFEDFPYVRSGHCRDNVRGKVSTICVDVYGAGRAAVWWELKLHSLRRRRVLSPVCTRLRGGLRLGSFGCWHDSLGCDDSISKVAGGGSIFGRTPPPARRKGFIDLPQPHSSPPPQRRRVGPRHRRLQRRRRGQSGCRGRRSPDDCHRGSAAQHRGFLSTFSAGASGRY
jgi:hypothetical protein